MASNDYMEKLLYPDHTKKPKIPVWVHAIGRFGLIAANGYLIYYLFSIEQVLIGILSILTFFYQIVVLFYGEEIRQFCIDSITKI